MTTILRKSGEIVADLGLGERDYIEDLIARKPREVRTVEWLAQNIVEVRHYTNKILALQAGVEYIDDVVGLQPHPLLSQDVQVRAFCDKRDALLFLEDGTQETVLLFADYDNFRRYRNQGLEQRLQDPITKALVDVVPRLAIGDRQKILDTLQGLHSHGSSADSGNAEAQDSVWSPSQADSENLRKLARFMDEAVLNGATDVALMPDRNGRVTVAYRKHGKMRRSPLEMEYTHAEEVTRFLMSRSRANPGGGRIFEPRNGQLTYRSTVGEIFIRASFIPMDRGGLTVDLISVSLRLLPRKAGSIRMNELKLPKAFISLSRNAMSYSQGLIILAGPTNSGKSTTIAGMVGEHVSMFGEKVKRLSIEDPVERYLPGILQITVPAHLKNGFAEVFASVLRHDPDMVWVGEVRETEAASTCVRAASSGHLVFTTLHANDTILAIKTLANLVDKAKHFDLVESLALVVGQRLVEHLCPNCAQASEPTPDERERFDYYCKINGIHATIPEMLYHAKPGGCEKCKGDGTIGILPVIEALPVTREVKNLLQTENPNFEAIASHREITMFGSGLELVQAGKTELDSVLV